MKTKLDFKVATVLAALFFLPAAHAALTSPADYKAGKAVIGAKYKADRAACHSISDNSKNICVEEAKAQEKTALAKLEFAHTGSFRDKHRVTVVAAESAYAVAEARCDDKSGNAKDVCITEAKAIEAKALADVKMTKKINAAIRDDVETKLGADYQIAIEKCGALEDDAKSSCVSKAKAKYGRS